MEKIVTKDAHVSGPCVVLPNGQSIRVLSADNFVKRLLGIHLQKPELNEALWIPGCRYVHTFLCPPIGIVFLRQWKVLSVHSYVLPNSIVGNIRADSVMEFIPGSILGLLQKGDVLKPIDI